MGTKQDSGGADPKALPLRPCVGVVLTNGRGDVFLGERIDTPGAWQFPQGGIDEGETPATAALRELEEEIGVSADGVVITAEHPDWQTYELPAELVGKVWKGRYRGQRQKWFLMTLTGDEGAIRLDVDHPEFSAWRWSTPVEATEAIVAFKRPIYRSILKYFGQHLGS